MSWSSTCIRGRGKKEEQISIRQWFQEWGKTGEKKEIQTEWFHKRDERWYGGKLLRSDKGLIRLSDEWDDTLEVGEKEEEEE